MATITLPDHDVYANIKEIDCRQSSLRSFKDHCNNPLSPRILSFTKHFNNLIKLTIYDCERLVGIEQLPILRYLCVDICPDLVGILNFHHL